MKIPLQDGYEEDALSIRARQVLRFKAGARKEIKRKYNKRFRKFLKRMMRAEVEDDT